MVISTSQALLPVQRIHLENPHPIPTAPSASSIHPLPSPGRATHRHCHCHHHRQRQHPAPSITAPFVCVHRLRPVIVSRGRLWETALY